MFFSLEQDFALIEERSLTHTHTRPLQTIYLHACLKDTNPN